MRDQGGARERENPMMESLCFGDGSITSLLRLRQIKGDDIGLHSSMIKRLTVHNSLQYGANALAWDPDGSHLLSTTYSKVRLWSYPHLELLQSFDLEMAAYSARFVPERSGGTLVLGCVDGTRVYDLSCLTGEISADSGAEYVGSPEEPLATYHCQTAVSEIVVEPGNPSTVWSIGDETVRQHDFRERNCCIDNRPPSLCHSIVSSSSSNVSSSSSNCCLLVDLRRGMKTSLSDSPKDPLTLTSCKMSPTNGNYLLVSGEDAFARLYDRRCLSLTSDVHKLDPPECVSYFCPKHLSGRRSALEQEPVYIKHVAFSPNGNGVLLSYVQEHSYLMDLCSGGQVPTCYTSANVPKHDKRKKQKGDATDTCVEGWQLWSQIEELNADIQNEKDPIEKHKMLCTRARLLLQRKWKNDVHMAIRDFKEALEDHSSLDAVRHLVDTFKLVGQHEDALSYVKTKIKSGSFDSQDTESLEDIKHHIETGISKNTPSSESDTKDGNFPSQLDDTELVDMRQRYVGPSLIYKPTEACFLGRHGEFVASGSSCGNMFIWERRTGKLIQMLKGECEYLRCIQSHPYENTLATCGDEGTIKIWSPMAAEREILLKDVWETINDMQRQMIQSNDLLNVRDYAIGSDSEYATAEPVPNHVLELINDMRRQMTESNDQLNVRHYATGSDSE